MNLNAVNAVERIVETIVINLYCCTIDVMSGENKYACGSVYIISKIFNSL